jgi:hypothetical protein
MTMEEYTEMVVASCRDSSGNWYWALKVNGELYADGEAENHMIAQSRVETAYDEWSAKQ